MHQQNFKDEYLNQPVFIRFYGGRSVFCKILAQDENVLLVKTDRKTKINLGRVKRIDIVKEEELQKVMIRLGLDKV